MIEAGPAGQGDYIDLSAAGLLSSPLLAPFFVYRRSRDLLGTLSGAAFFGSTFLNVLVLPFIFCRPTLRHYSISFKMAISNFHASDWTRLQSFSSERALRTSIALTLGIRHAYYIP